MRAPMTGPAERLPAPPYDPGRAGGWAPVQFRPGAPFPCVVVAAGLYPATDLFPSPTLYPLAEVVRC